MSDFCWQCTGFDCVIGTFAAIPSPVAIKVTEVSSLDFVRITVEYSQIVRDPIEHLIRASDAPRVPATVRVPGRVPLSLARMLDADRAQVAPRAATAAPARATVMANLYPPVGDQGVGPRRAAGYRDHITDYLTNTDDRLVLAVQIETADGLANVEEPEVTEGIDLIFTRTDNLSITLNAMSLKGVEMPDVAIVKIITAARSIGTAVGIVRPLPEDIERRSQADISFYPLASGTMFLDAILAAGVSAAQNALDWSPRERTREGHPI